MMRLDPHHPCPDLTSKAKEAGIVVGELLRLLTVTHDGSGYWADAFLQTLAFLEREDWFAKLTKAATLRAAKWLEDDKSAVIRACQAMPAAAELDTDERLACIRAPQLRQFANEHTLAMGGILTGPTGAGKTMAVVHLVDRAIRVARISSRETQIAAHADTIIPTAPDVRVVAASAIGTCVEFGQVKTGEVDDSRSPRNVDAWCSCDWLGIDDLGWESKSGRMAIHHVVAARYAKGLPTLVTTGMPLADIPTEYGSALLRRIVECRGQAGPVIEVSP